MMSDFNLSITVRNAHILKRVRNMYGSSSVMCRETGMSRPKVSALMTMREKPFRENGELTTCAEDLCSALGATPDELWPKQIAKMQAKKARYEIEISQAEAMAVTSSSEVNTIQRQLIERWADGLSPRYLLALEMQQQGATLEEIGAEMNVTRERARQILIRAQRHMRTKASHDNIKSFYEIEAL
jgi:DNA-directed RNA polymerase sigma subunit (sigma70/sigma32)